MINVALLSVIRLGLEARDGFIALPHSLDLVPVLVEVAATVAMCHVVGVVVLKCVHGYLELFKGLCNRWC